MKPPEMLLVFMTIRNIVVSKTTKLNKNELLHFGCNKADIRRNEEHVSTKDHDMEPEKEEAKVQASKLSCAPSVLCVCSI